LGVKLDEKLLDSVLEDEVRIVAKIKNYFARVHGYVKDLADELNNKLGNPEEVTQKSASFR
jgi:hypothetical protein